MAQTTIIHLSDLHIGKGTGEKIHLSRIADKIKTDYQGARVIITGDLTNASSKKQFRHVCELLETLPPENPVLVVPGNHDCAVGPFGSCYSPVARRNYRNYFGSPSEWTGSGVEWQSKIVDGLDVWVDDLVVYCGVDSCIPKSCWNLIITNGLMSEELADNLKATLDAHHARTRVVFLHHHPFALVPDFVALDGKERLLAALQNRCELLLFGHRHRHHTWERENGILLSIASRKSTAKKEGIVLVPIITITHSEGPAVSFHYSEVAV